ncbi:MAG: NAD-dependent epimerase/dehydratase family protein [Nitrospiria bacterium]
MKFTVLGATGFIGSHLSEFLMKAGEECLTPYRDDPAIYGQNLGHVLYCIGLTADFRERPFDTIRAHVVHLMHVLENCTFDSFLYLSSTRLYLKGNQAEETVDIRVNANDPEDLYNLSKLMGESVCFASDHPNVRVARLSNVFGKKEGGADFLSSVIHDAVERGKVVLTTSMASEKDYVSVEDVVALLPKIAVSGRERLYNVASGENISNRILLREIQRHTGCAVTMADHTQVSRFPEIAITRIKSEFGFLAKGLIPAIGGLIPQYAAKGVS